MPKQRVIEPKQRCCGSSPRCKRCPIVCQRLARVALAEQLDDGRYLLAKEVRKKHLKAARS